MGARHIVGMKPDVAAVRDPESDLVVLGIVFSYIYIVAVAAQIVERLTLRGACAPFFRVFFLSGISAAQVTALLHLPADLGEIGIRCGEFQGVLNAAEMIDLSLDFDSEAGKRFMSPLHAGVAVKIFLRVLLGGQSRIQGDPDLFTGIIIVDFTAVGAGADGVAVGVEQFAVDLVFVALFRIADLAALQVVFMNVALQNGLHDVAEIRGALADAGVEILSGVKILQKDRRRFVGDFYAVRIVAEGDQRKVHRSSGTSCLIPPAVHFRRETALADFPGQAFEAFPEGLFFGIREHGRGPILGQTGAVNNLLGCDGRKTGVGAHEEFGGFHVAAVYYMEETFPGLSERILFGLCVGNEIGSSGEHLTHGTDQR